MKGRKGFTLMELMIVIAIIMILTGAIVARITTGTEKAKQSKARGEMAEIAAAVKAFYLDAGYWPYNNTDAGYSSATGDAGLVTKDNIITVITDTGDATSNAGIIASVKAKWKGPYLEAMEWPLDSWGTRRYWVYYYSSAPKALYVLCFGPDMLNNGQWNWNTGVVNSGDDIQLLVHRF